MNLFNVSSPQTPKSVVSSAATAESETITLSDDDFSQQYQQALDASQPLLTSNNSELVSTDDISIDSKTSDTDVITAQEQNIVAQDIVTPNTVAVYNDINDDTVTIDDNGKTLTDASMTDVVVTGNAATDIVTSNTATDDRAATDTVTKDSKALPAADDISQLMAAGNVFLQQLTQSNQQLNGTLSAEAGMVDNSGKSLPPATTALQTSMAAATAIESQKADIDIDSGVNNLPLPTVATSVTATVTTPTSDMLQSMENLEAGDLLASKSRLSQAATMNSNSESLAQQLAGLTTPSATALKPELTPPMTPAQSPLLLTREQAGEQVHERINIMMAKNLKHVDIRLDPPELGKIQIKLNITQDQASVQFTVNNPQTRDMVEQAMPRLREMLQQQGLQLAQSSVQQETPQQFSGQQNNHAANSQSGQQSSSMIIATEGQSQPEVDQPQLHSQLLVTDNKDHVDYYA
ncbi:flagellar hook-length control protein FliK [Photobacterium andalusiense]|uniref:Flagellar hook-length control protein n=1 Tax=Photobacterium andalusiense TaxID=2204296 RepID=A0A1Y6M5H9_9GAMM|nr:flagellar hook-length control protein FliK [Photobacterium andalusiense]SMY31835.1 Flagellar hook-length control protein [Photobacterium andalusiense]